VFSIIPSNSVDKKSVSCYFQTEDIFSPPNANIGTYKLCSRRYVHLCVNDFFLHC